MRDLFGSSIHYEDIVLVSELKINNLINILTKAGKIKNHKRSQLEFNLDLN